MSRFPDRFPQHDHLLDRGRPFGIDPVHFGIIYPRRGGRLESILVFYIPMGIVLFLVT